MHSLMNSIMTIVIKNPSLRKMQVVLSLFRIKSEERKVRATQGIPLSNGKGFRNENLDHGLVQQKIYRPGFTSG
ncbi:hypothetical protein SAMN04488511_10160 [Pedobacter suwonensis]|uniref:Uncharacterized protein n=1 Tax=Pedobacter suwonensis TaxID=332999 RepID=A0A1I0SEE0_9SPHI|nr:hypothetical protein SAMN04488511_10160 [Pedobacter suwonensis]